MHLHALSQLSIVLATFVSQTSAFWRMPCAGPVVTERADPVVNPGLVSGHVHTVMGASNFNYTTTYEDLRASDCTTCEIAQDLSSYWVPSLYFHDKVKNTFTDIKQVGGMLVYYIQRYGYTGEQLYAFPDGFRMLAGDPMLRSNAGTLASQAISYHCLNYSNPGLPETPFFPTTACPDGLRQQIFFPSCWDGVNVDSTTHKSHVAYPSNSDSGTCPSTHPYRLVSLFYEVIWNTYAYYPQLSAGTGEIVLSTGDPTGYGSHADFVNGWDHTVLQNAVDTCLDDSGVFTDCPLFDIIPASTAAQCKKAPATAEVTVGTLQKLPGNNPVQYGPAAAVMQSYVNTILAGTVLDPSLGISDASVRNASQFPQAITVASKGCYADGYPLSRSMPGLGQYGVFATDAMTNSLCSQYCLAQGFAYSGTEYASQCFCANAPPPKILAASACNMACSGDATAMCGGDNALSVSYNPAGAKYVSAAAAATGTSTTTKSASTTTAAATATATATTGYTTSGTCNGTPFTTGQYVCWGNKQLCQVNQGVVYQACSGACYDPSLYSCPNGFLLPTTAKATTSTTSTKKTTTTSSSSSTTATGRPKMMTTTRVVATERPVFTTTARTGRPIFVTTTGTSVAKATGVAKILSRNVPLSFRAVPAVY